MILSIKDKVIIVLVGLLVLAVVCIWGYRKSLIQTEEELKTETNNTRVLETNPDTTYTKKGERVITTGELKQTIKEMLQTDRKGQLQQVKDMGIKLRNVESISQELLKVSHTDTIVVKEVIYVDSTRNLYRKEKVGVTSDKWFTTSVRMWGDTTVTNTVYEDSAVLVKHRKPIGKMKWWNVVIPRKRENVNSIKLGCPNATIILKETIIDK